jgi:hypothetical protein
MSELETLRQQMAQINARLSHLEQHGVVSPNTTPTQRVNGEVSGRLNQGFYSRLDKLAHQLRNHVIERYRSLAHGDNLRSALGAHVSVSAGQELVNRVPYDIASQLTRETMVRDDIKSAQRAHALRGGNGSKLQRLEVELKTVSHHTQELLKHTSLPVVPSDLKAKIANLSTPIARNHNPFAYGRD